MIVTISFIFRGVKILMNEIVVAAAVEAVAAAGGGVVIASVEGGSRKGQR